jgi:hypothetical protein
MSLSDSDRFSQIGGVERLEAKSVPTAFSLAVYGLMPALKTTDHG